MRQLGIQKLVHSRGVKKCGEKSIQKRDVEIVEFLDELQPHGDTVVKNGMIPWIRLTLIEKQ